MPDKKFINNIEKDDESSEAVIHGEVPKEDFEKERSDSIKALGKDLSIPGFRKGNVPEKVLIEKVGEDKILQEMAERALQKAYPKIIKESELNIISQPQIQITKMAKDNPLGFKVKVATMPDIKIADYKKIASSVEKPNDNVEVSEKEVEDSISRIKESLEQQKKGSKEDPEASSEENTQESDKKGKDELTNEDVKKIGDYKDVDDFKKKLRESLKQQKTMKQKEKVRVEIIEKIIKESKIPVPDVLVEAELRKMMHQFMHDIERMGMEPKEYLKNIGKSEEDLKKEWREDAKKRVQMELVIREIALKEELVPDKDAVTKETKHLMSHYPDAEEKNIRVYVEHSLTTEAVFEFLENQSQ